MEDTSNGYKTLKIAFINIIIEEEVYNEQLQGFEISGKESHVCKLKKVQIGTKSVVFHDLWRPTRYGLH